VSSRSGEPSPGWLPKAPSPADNPHSTLAFARAYERAATRITGPVSVAALDRLGQVDRDTQLLDIGAGTGAFSVPAAHTGAHVTAIDIAPGMVQLLGERLAPFPRARALEMDGQAMEFADSRFDAAVSIVGVTIFPDWRQGIAEQVRVVRPGGVAVVATWRTLPGGGPFVIMAEALRSVFPDQRPPTPPPGFVELSDPQAMADRLGDAGLRDVAVEEIEAVWEGPAGPDYLEELRDFHPFIGPYAALDDAARARLDAAIVEAVDRRAEGGTVTLATTVTLGSGIRP
jgi:SAM-dependent methyltransferase